MQLSFSINYNTVFGESVHLRVMPLKKSRSAQPKLLNLAYQNGGHWQVDIADAKVELFTSFSYKYELHNYGILKEVLQRDAHINLEKIHGERMHIVDEWVPNDIHIELFKTRPFKVFNNKLNLSNAKKKKAKQATHHLHVTCPALPGGHVLCLAGDGKKLHNWSEESPVFLQPVASGWQANFKLKSKTLPLSFKLAVYNVAAKKIVAWEPGSDRMFAQHSTVVLENTQVNFADHLFKAAGINVQLSSLKTKYSEGVGDFCDLFELVDICTASGLKLIQLLPLNDTISTYTDKDSYPYSAISAFALHPIFLNLRQLALDYDTEIPAAEMAFLQEHNNAPFLQYSSVVEAKMYVAGKLFNEIEKTLASDKTYQRFVKENHHWLHPYAVFCLMRDVDEKPDFKDFGGFEHYTEHAVNAWIKTDVAFATRIAFQYFLQFALHKQLQSATAYAHKHHIILKADLPIGVGRHSVETWVHPELFNMDMQAGAPPDAFAVAGQNWSFPTYNWPAMANDQYDWWRERMTHLSKNFDAVRIDHVLGFFRIWSIPLHARQGILGHFVPANAVTPAMFYAAGLQLDFNRLCQPFISDDILNFYFGDEAEYVANHFLDGDVVKPEFDTQAKIAEYIALNQEWENMQEGLFNLLANVVLIAEANNEGFHFRINMFDTPGYKQLDDHSKGILHNMYNAYFYHLQNELWAAEGVEKLQALREASNSMLLCGEDLGMVPEMVPGILHNLHILGLQVERMPKQPAQLFALAASAPYDCVVTPGTHDMSTVRMWWQEDTATTQKYYSDALSGQGTAPQEADEQICSRIIEQHLHSPAMLSIFLIQDLLAISSSLKRPDASEERINVPADADHIWNYRLHINLEDIEADPYFMNALKSMVTQAGR